MPKFEINVRGQNFEVEAADESALPAIAQQIYNEQEFQATERVEDIPGAAPTEFIGEITNPPGVIEKIKRSLPAAGQFAGGVAGGLLGAKVKRPQLGGAVGGTIGRAAGELSKSYIRQATDDFGKFVMDQATGGPFFGTIKGMADSERRRFGKEVLKTGALEAAFAPLGAAVSGIGTGITESIGRALLGDRVVERGKDVGFKRILDPKFYKGRLAKDVAVKTNNFFKKLTDVTGKKTAAAINREGVGTAPAPVNDIKAQIIDLDTTLGSIDDFGPEVSTAQKNIIKNLRQQFLELDEGVTISDLWSKRKDMDRTIYNKRFVGEGDEYLEKLRRIVAKPIRESSEEVKEAFSRYSFVKDQEKNLGKKLSAETLGDPEAGGEIFAPQTEQFISTLQKTSKDETARLLKQLDSFLDADDQVVEGLLDAAAAEAIENQSIGLAGPFGRSAIKLLGGKRAIAGVGALGQSPEARVIKRVGGRVIPVTASELIAESEDELE